MNDLVLSANAYVQIVCHKASSSDTRVDMFSSLTLSLDPNIHIMGKQEKQK
jgi:hypothetical protein